MGHRVRWAHGGPGLGHLRQLPPFLGSWSLLSYPYPGVWETRNKEIVPPGVGVEGHHSLYSRPLSKELTWLLWEPENWLPDLTPLSSNTSSAPPWLPRGGGRDFGLGSDTSTPKLLGKPGFLVCGVTQRDPNSSPGIQMYYTPSIPQPKIPHTYLQDTHKFLGRSSRPFFLPLSLSHTAATQSLFPQNLYIVNRSNRMLALPHPQGSETPSSPCCLRGPPQPNISTVLLPQQSSLCPKTPFSWISQVSLGNLSDSLGF